MQRVNVSPRIIRAWYLYDWASSAFVTTVMAALFPPFFRSLVLAGGVAENSATAYWAYTTSLALLLIALSAPLLGAIADHTGRVKQGLVLFAGLGILATACMVFLGPGAWRTAAILFVCGNFGFGCANVFYESLLPRLVPREQLDSVSARGYALGYVGGGILLVINLLWVMRPEMFGMPDTGVAVRASLLSAAAWWGIFAVPLVRHFPHIEGVARGAGTRAAWRSGWGRLAETLRAIGRYRQLALFLLAFWLYNDGIGTIVKMATAYGDEIGIDLNDMILALVITQFVGIPCSLLFGELGRRWGTRRALLLSLGVYVLISIGGYFMQTAVHFYALALAVGTVQGGAQALSRSLYAAMVPKGRATEFFGFFSASARFAGIAGPLVFGLVGQLTGTSRLSLLSVSIFLVLGGLLLTRVDIERGVREAQRASGVAR